MWVDRLQELGEELHESSPESPKSVAAHNALADEIRVLILDVVRSEERNALFEFLSDPALRGWIAYIALKQDDLTDEQRKRCISVIQDLAQGSGPNALAANWWIRDNVT